MKGVSAIAVLVILIVVGVVVYFIFSGGLGPRPIRTSDNTVVHIVDKLISNSAPFSGAETTIDFSVANSGDKLLDNVTVNFGDVSGFDKYSLGCQIIDSPKSFPVPGKWCNMTGIQPGDAREVRISLIAT